jgi:hypothetical protein
VLYRQHDSLQQLQCFIYYYLFCEESVSTLDPLPTGEVNCLLAIGYYNRHSSLIPVLSSYEWVGTQFT